MNKIKVQWQADDGYVGGGRPQSFDLDLADMVESCVDEEDAREYLTNEIDTDFQNKVTWSCRNFDGVMEAWRDAKAVAEKGE